MDVATDTHTDMDTESTADMINATGTTTAMTRNMDTDTVTNTATDIDTDRGPNTATDIEMARHSYLYKGHKHIKCICTTCLSRALLAFTSKYRASAIFKYLEAFTVFDILYVSHDYDGQYLYSYQAVVTDDTANNLLHLKSKAAGTVYSSRLDAEAM